MELLNGPEFKEMRNVCQDTMKTFGMLFLTCAQSELFADAIESHRNRLASSLKAPTVQFPLRPSREIAPSRLSSSIPPHIHDDNHTYEQDPGSKITASIIGWREIQALTHYGVYVIEVVCSDGRPPKWVYKRYRDFERLHNVYGKMVSTGVKVKMPSTSSSSNFTTREFSVTGSPNTKTKGGGNEKKGNKFDPAFHTQRAAELQPLLTALCQRSDVFGLTKFMRWLFFDKKKDTPLLSIFEKALNQTLEVYGIKTPVYANNMVDALTWLMYLRISHIWEKVRKGIQFLAVRAVQDVILKAIRPMDDMILQLNEMSIHIHSLLKRQPGVLLRPKESLDSLLTSAYKSIFAAYENPVSMVVNVFSSQLIPPFLSINTIIKSRLGDLVRSVSSNLLMDGDELSITALVQSIEAVFETIRGEALPILERSILILHHSLTEKFSSQSLQKSFSGIVHIVPAIPRLLDAVLHPQTILDLFIKALRWRHAVESFDPYTTDEHTMAMLLNDLETEFEREVEKVEIHLKLKARSLQAQIRRLHPTCASLADPFGDSMMKFALMWAKYLRRFSKMAANLIAAQHITKIPLSWNLAVRDCIVLAFQKSNDYFVNKAIKITHSFIQSTLVTLFDPLILALSNQISAAELINAESLLKPHSISLVFSSTSTYSSSASSHHVTATPSSSSSNSSTINGGTSSVSPTSPTTGSTAPTPAQQSAIMTKEISMTEILDPQKYIARITRLLFEESLNSTLETFFFGPLRKAWSEIPSAHVTPEEDLKRQIRLDELYQRLMGEMQSMEMDEEMKRESFRYENKRETIAGGMSLVLDLTPMKKRNPTGTGSPLPSSPRGSNGSSTSSSTAMNHTVAARTGASAGSAASSNAPTSPRQIELKQPVVFTESPVAKVIGRSQGDSPPGVSLSPEEASPIDSKKLGKDLQMLARVSERDGAKASAVRSGSEAPPLVFDFELEKHTSLEAPVSAKNVWAAASASRASFRVSRVFYEIPDTMPNPPSVTDTTSAFTSNTSMPASETSSVHPEASSQTTKTSLAPGSPTAASTRLVPRKPTLGGRPSRSPTSGSAQPVSEETPSRKSSVALAAPSSAAASHSSQSNFTTSSTSSRASTSTTSSTADSPTTHSESSTSKRYPSPSASGWASCVPSSVLARHTSHSTNTVSDGGGFSSSSSPTPSTPESLTATLSATETESSSQVASAVPSGLLAQSRPSSLSNGGSVVMTGELPASIRLPTRPRAGKK